MSGEIINDSRSDPPVDLPDRPEVPANASAVPAADTDTRRRKPRVRKPRPCFDDGALTRVFKFPSKSYPRSSYYVTGDEIIIRIKKARKRWKLVIPKKRVVAYRTNRWFAKPRWVELELTYTQAVRLGLIEARAASGVGNADAPVPLAGDAVAAMGAAPFDVAESLQSGADDDGSETSVELEDFDIEKELTPEVEAESEEYEDSEAAAEPDSSPVTLPEPSWSWGAGQDKSPVIARADEAEPAFDTVADNAASHEDRAEVLPPKSIVPGFASASGEIRIHEPVALIDEDRSGGQQPFDESPAFREGRNPKLERANYALPIAAALALMIVGSAGGLLWSSGDPAGEPVGVADRTVCSGNPGECGQDFVTGSIAAIERAPTEAVDPVAPIEPWPTVLEIQAAREPGQRDIEAAEPASADVTSAAVEVPLAPHADTNVEVRSVLGEAAGARSENCQQAEAAAQSLRVQFQYASDRIEPALVLELIALADRLRACPSLKITMGGHTDSDGHPDRNQGLSLRRAETVLAVLAQSGVAAERMSAVGFGQSSPLVANDTPGNRRLNRRVEFSVGYDR